MRKKYDLIIAGGGTAGCAAAYVAGKAGLSVLLIEKNGCLGGSMTAGLVVPAMKSSKNQINTDFFNILISKMKKLNCQVTYQENAGWFNPEVMKIVLDELMSDAKVDVLFNTFLNDIVVENNRAVSIKISNFLSPYNDKIHTDKSLPEQNILSSYIYTRYLIDATGNAEIFQKLNCEFLENEKENQPFSLRFIAGGIDLDKFSKWLLEVDKDRDVTTVELIGGTIHLSTACTWDNSRKWALSQYFDDAISKGILKPNDNNYFQVFSIPNMPDSLAFNCPRIVDIEAKTDPISISNALIEGRKAILRLINFCKIYFPGFENAYISNVSDMLGIRCSNRIKGKYVLTMNDILEGKTFANPVAVADYPIDVHSKDKNGSVLKKVQDYEVPIESLMSTDYDNLFAIGRCISADTMAQGAIRIQPTCFSMGEGLAKYLVKQITK